jgi:WD40 repeat protein
MGGIAFSPDGRWLAWSGAEPDVHLLSIADGTDGKLSTLKGHGATVRPVAFSPDSRHLVTGSDDRTARVWSIPDGPGGVDSTSSVLAHQSALFVIRFDAKGTFITICGDRSIHAWDLASLAELDVFRSQNPVANGGTISMDGRHVAGLFEGEPLVRLWPITTAPPENSLGSLEQLSSARLGPTNEVESPLRPAQ